MDLSAVWALVRILVLDNLYCFILHRSATDLNMVESAAKS